jgi:hypothetical protein
MSDHRTQLPPGQTRDTLIALARLLARRAAKRQAATKSAQDREAAKA